MRATQPGYRRLLGKAFHLLASVWVVGPVQDTQCGFKGFTRAAAQDLFARQQVTSIVFDVEIIYLVRARGYRFADRAHPLVRQARLAHARAARSGPAGGLGPVPHPAAAPRQRARQGSGTVLMDVAGRWSGLARAALPIVALLSFAGGVGLTIAAAGDTLGYDFLAYHQAAERLLAGRAAVRHVVHGVGRVRPVLLPADLRPAHPAARAAVGRCGHDGLDRQLAPRVRGRRGHPAGLALGPLVGRAPGRLVVPVRVRGQARPGRTDPVRPVRGRLALAGRPGPPGPERRAGRRDQDPAGAHPRLGAADPAVRRGRRRRRRPRRPRRGRRAAGRGGRLDRLPDPAADGHRPDHDGAQLHARARSPTSSACPHATATLIQFASTAAVGGGRPGRRSDAARRRRPILWP